MSTPNQTTALGIVRCTYADMMAPLPRAALVALSRRLLEADLVVSGSVVSVERCETTVECCDLLVSLLLSLGMSKFTKVKEVVRAFSKDYGSEVESSSGGTVSPVPVKSRTQSPKPSVDTHTASNDDVPPIAIRHRKFEKHELYAKVRPPYMVSLDRGVLYVHVEVPSFIEYIHVDMLFYNTCTCRCDYMCVCKYGVTYHMVVGDYFRVFHKFIYYG